MAISINTVCGVMLGFEFHNDEEGNNYLIVDLLLIRLIFGWVRNELN